MPEKAWKADERKVAKFFGTVRNPLSGSASRHTSSDSLHENLFIDNKREQNHSILNRWRIIQLKAKLERKIPVLTLTEPKQAGFWIVVHSDDLLKVAEGAQKAMKQKQ